MTKVATSVLNFSRGKMDHDLNSRYDLPIYSSGLDTFKNFFSNFKGSASFRTGLENILKYEDCQILEFRFNKEQSYLLVFTDLKLRLLSYDVSNNLGWVLDAGSNILEVVTPYTLAQAKQITERSIAQNADVMYIVHPTHPPMKLTRVAANNFTLATFVRTADPFGSATNYPSCVSFYKGGLYYGATDTEVTTIWRSQLADFDNMTVGASDDDGLKFAVSDLTERILWLAPGNNSLIGGSSQALIAINGGSTDAPITPSTVSAFITNTAGANETQPIRKDNLLFYINSWQRNVNFFNYDLLTESFIAQDCNRVSYDITKGTISGLRYKKDRNDLLFMICQNHLVSLNFDEGEKIVGWHEHESVGEIKTITTMSNNQGDIDLFALVKYKTNFFICRMAPEAEFPLFDTFFTDNEAEDKDAFTRYTTEILKGLIYSDISQIVKNEYTSSLTYAGDTDVGDAGTITSTANDFAAGDVDRLIHFKTKTGREYGIFKITAYTDADEVEVEVMREPSTATYDSWYKSFTEVSGLTDFIGETLVVVADGGYLGEFVVDDVGKIDLGRETSVACVGFAYEGLIKTFNLGFIVQGVNTQVTAKNIRRAVLRFVSSAGGKVGTSQYRMEDIQDYDPTGLYDNAPLPMDGDKSVRFSDISSKEKCLYIKQDKPLPMKLTGIVMEADYTMNL